MSEMIRIDDLLEGDVLLYRGRSFVSRAIQFFDGTEVSHAAVYLGNHEVGEAVAKGLMRQDYGVGAKGNEWVQAHRLKDRPYDMGPVLTKAAEYLDEGNRYGFEQLLLLAFLCLTRKLKVSPSLRVLIRTVLDASASILTQLLSEEREPMICSEFVYRAYDEALPEMDDLYSLSVNIALPMVVRGVEVTARPTVRGQGVHPQSLLAQLPASDRDVRMVRASEHEPTAVDEGEIDALIEAYLGEVRQAPSRAVEVERVVDETRAASDRFAYSLYAAYQGQPVEEVERGAAYEHLLKTAADFVTPGDLIKTQSLFLLGRIED